MADLTVNVINRNSRVVMILLHIFNNFVFADGMLKQTCFSIDEDNIKVCTAYDTLCCTHITLLLMFNN